MICCKQVHQSARVSDEKGSMVGFTGQFKAQYRNLASGQIRKRRWLMHGLYTRVLQGMSVMLLGWMHNPFPRDYEIHIQDQV
jgi:hypothetical protein